MNISKKVDYAFSILAFLWSEESLQKQKVNQLQSLDKKHRRVSSNNNQIFKISKSTNTKLPTTLLKISNSTGVPYYFAEKIANLLKNNSYIKATKGKHGGYKLNCDIEKLSLARVMEDIEGPIRITDCISNNDKVCDIIDTCPINTKWSMVNRVLYEALDNITVSDLISEQRK